MSRLRLVPLTVEENQTYICSQNWGLIFPYENSLDLSLIFCDLLNLCICWLLHSLTCLLEEHITLPLKADNKTVHEGRVTTTHTFFMRKTEAFPKSSRLLLTSHWLGTCYIEKQKFLLCTVSPATWLSACEVDGIVCANGGRFPVESLSSASGISQKPWWSWVALKQWETRIILLTSCSSEGQFCGLFYIVLHSSSKSPVDWIPVPPVKAS